MSRWPAKPACCGNPAGGLHSMPKACGKADCRKDVALLLLLASWASAAMNAKAQHIEAISVDGARFSGELVQVAPELQLRTSDGEITLDWSELMSLRRVTTAASQPAQAAREGHWFRLADGSYFQALLASSDGDEVTLALRDGQRATLPRTAIESITAAALSSRVRALFEQNVREAESSGEDVAIVTKGEEALPLRGAIRAMEPQRVVFAWKGRDLSAPWEKLAALQIGRPLPRGASGLAHMSNGEVFAGRVVSGDREAIVLKSSSYEALRLAWPDLERIELASERVRYLSDAQPARYEFEPFLERRWLAARDRTLSGQPIRLGGKTYEKGLTLHSRALLSYSLGGAFRRFAATIGVPDELGAIGAATVRVIGDDKVLWEAADVRGGESPREVSVEVAGMAELSLVVEFGANLDIGDHISFANARVIR